MAFWDTPDNYVMQSSGDSQYNFQIVPYDMPDATISAPAQRSQTETNDSVFKPINDFLGGLFSTVQYAISGAQAVKAQVTPPSAPAVDTAGNVGATAPLSGMPNPNDKLMQSVIIAGIVWAAFKK